MKFSHDADYWNQKTVAFVHDPPDKAIHIPGHEERSNRLIEALGIHASLSKDKYQLADVIASGMDRAVLPGFSKNKEEDCSADFCSTPILTHPTGSAHHLDLNLNINNGPDLVKEISGKMIELVKHDLDGDGEESGLSNMSPYKNNETAFAFARFNYLFFLLRHRLSRKNVGGLGGAWHRIPADTRLPDHSIWQHCGLVSALASCFRLSKKNRASLMVFAISPVQDFIGRARKLRDYWTGSILLSWLAFEGIKAVIYELGPDHILYPSLHGQPLVEGLLAEWGMKDFLLDAPRYKYKGVASFPNKFVCLVPCGYESAVAEKIKGAIQEKWLELGNTTCRLIEETVGKKDEYIRQQFTRQLKDYWEYYWAASPLVRKDDICSIEHLLCKDSIKQVLEFMSDSYSLLEKKNISQLAQGEGLLYSITHRLSQTMLAASKSYRTDNRVEEPGIKCDMFGEYEILHFAFKDGDDFNPRPSEDPFWTTFKKRWKPGSDFGKTERLCAIAMVKRLAYRACKRIDNHPLTRFFEEAEAFPSTTEMALHNWWHSLRGKAKEDKKLASDLAEFHQSGIDSPQVRKQLAQWFHIINEPEDVSRHGHEITDVEERLEIVAKRIFKIHKVREHDKYYAVLMMDGDKMGSLINGETIGATWRSVLHPKPVSILQGKFDEDYKGFWNKYFSLLRHISPSVHAAISESLGDFSLYTVPEIITKRYHGRLIYAGGDDVCAVLPAATVLDAARDIALNYCNGFVFIDHDGHANSLSDQWSPEPGKLAVYLGRAEKISISAGILIAHHKKPLKNVIARAHELLEMAKEENNRNGFALELAKRAGVGRVFLGRWDDLESLERSEGGNTVLDHFLGLAKKIQGIEGPAMSSSLAYRIQEFKDGLLPLLDRPELLIAFLKKQMERSATASKLPEGEREKTLAKTARHVAEILVHQSKKRGFFVAEPVIVAKFIGQCKKSMEELYD